MTFEAKVAAITGASSGLGAEMARQLARMGLTIGLTARRADRLEEVARQIRAEGGTAIVALADASDPASTRSALSEIARQLGPVDLLIANAGVGEPTPARSFSAEAFERMVRVNLTGAAYAIDAVLPSMIERGRGQIVGVSSLAGYRGLPGTAGYSATKAGLSALLEGLRPELKRLGIAVTTVHPGYVRTEMTAGQSGPMPFLMDADRAVRIILRGVAARRSRVDFPRAVSGFLSLVRLLPDPLYDPLAARILLGPPAREAK
ncbi:SDR family NAD(P)-dependent oxidoreductase [Tundrisphaera lichenicola]|uniref:SDR family NAD(P)-dependent oxidoreductase n=1 Tax=Tundrisphaera lichenicola TaxID=2029860 RepID=UPI003EB72ECC